MILKFWFSHQCKNMVLNLQMCSRHAPFSIFMIILRSWIFDKSCWVIWTEFFSLINHGKSSKISPRAFLSIPTIFVSIGPTFISRRDIPKSALLISGWFHAGIRHACQEGDIAFSGKSVTKSYSGDFRLDAARGPSGGPTPSQSPTRSSRKADKRFSERSLIKLDDI